MGVDPPIPRFDPADAMAILTGLRRERYPLEKELALIGLSAWMLFPKDSGLVLTAQVVGAANYYTHLSSKARDKIARTNPFFAASTLARTLLAYPAIGPLKENWKFAKAYDLEDIFDIIQFFLICPTEEKPSLLKALFFIDRGGFVSNVSDQDEKGRKGRSPSTLKGSWVRCAVRGPFIWAAVGSKYEFLLEIPPEERSSIEKIERFLSHPNAALEYFGMARFCQERLHDRLDRKSKSRFRFIRFPKNVPLLELELPTLDPLQIRFLREYRTPKLI
jgi:hypothetical protein